LIGGPQQLGRLSHHTRARAERGRKDVYRLRPGGTVTITMHIARFFERGESLMLASPHAGSIRTIVARRSTSGSARTRGPMCKPFQCHTYSNIHFGVAGPKHILVVEDDVSLRGCSAPPWATPASMCANQVCRRTMQLVRTRSFE
jgi:hypothetical protein